MLRAAFAHDQPQRGQKPDPTPDGRRRERPRLFTLLLMLRPPRFGCGSLVANLSAFLPHDVSVAGSCFFRVPLAESVERLRKVAFARNHAGRVVSKRGPALLAPPAHQKGDDLVDLPVKDGQELTLRLAVGTESGGTRTSRRALRVCGMPPPPTRPATASTPRPRQGVAHARLNRVAPSIR